MRDDHIIRDLGGGLVLRAATPDDMEAVADCYGDVFRSRETGGVNEGIKTWARDLMGGKHPTCDATQFTVVEDTGSGAIASACGFIPQTWTYDGVPFGVGRPEIVATREHYRKRGLIRAQFEVLHRWSAEQGHLAQVIDGIHWYYRQYGYDLAIAQWSGREGPLGRITGLKDGQTEPFRVRQAAPEDIPFLRMLYDHMVHRSLIACARDERIWRFEMVEKHESRRLVYRILETLDGKPVGCLILIKRGGRWVHVVVYELVDGISWLSVTPTVLRYLREYAETVNAESSPRPDAVRLLGTASHPVFQAYPSLFPVPFEHVHPAWYVRVPDPPAFLNRISPVLERRLAESCAVGHTGELKLSFYANGVALRFDGGRITADAWSPTIEDQGEAGFPYLTFLQLLFGYRSLSALESAYADCWANKDEARTILNILFPERPSFIWDLS